MHLFFFSYFIPYKERNLKYKNYFDSISLWMKSQRDGQSQDVQYRSPPLIRPRISAMKKWSYKRGGLSLGEHFSSIQQSQYLRNLALKRGMACVWSSLIRQGLLYYNIVIFGNYIICFLGYNILFCPNNKNNIYINNSVLIKCNFPLI